MVPLPFKFAWSTVLPNGARDARLVASPEGVTVVGTGALEGQTLRGGTDAFVVRVRPDGTRAWVRQFGTIFDDSAAIWRLGESATRAPAVTHVGTF